jgi:diguanylate cyclase (GGDEF)-like protein
MSRLKGRMTMSDDKTASPANEPAYPWLDLGLCESMYGPEPAPVAIWDRDGRLTYANRAALVLFRLGLDQARGRDLRFLLQPLPRSGESAGNRPGELAFPLVDGEAFPVQSPDGPQLLVLTAQLGESAGAGPWWITNILEAGATAGAERSGEVMRQVSLHDDLTGLPNRALFIDRLEHVLRAAQRDDSSSALCLIELDHFDEVISAEGAAASDRMLQEAAAGIASTLRNVDTVARLGDQRFAVLLPGASELGAVTAAVRIRESLEQPVALAEYSTDLSPRIGIAMSPLHASDATALIAFAETALQAAKHDESRCVLYAAGIDAVREV